MSTTNTLQTGPQLDAFDVANFLREREEPSELWTARALATRSRWWVTFLTIATVLAWGAACWAAIENLDFYFRDAGSSLVAEYRYSKFQEETRKQFADFSDMPVDRQTEFEEIRSAVNMERRLLRDSAREAVILFGIAALLSIWLTIASRRASLRQINANLLSITLELKKVLPPPT
ncbi:MAG: hypothetical protein SGJ20_04575 [Planctomycetota bacterium]|nr:hypothetical protein [Planctomycetota bacterium]